MIKSMTDTEFQVQNAKKLIGYKITNIVIDKDYFGFLVKKKGNPTLIVWVLSDEEGNFHGCLNISEDT